MLESERDMMKRRLASLGAERGDALVIIQKYFDDTFGVGRVRTRKLDRDGTLWLVTESAPLASDIQLNRIQLLEKLQKFEPSLTKLVVAIG
jgi:hypothetical protein